MVCFVYIILIYVYVNQWILFCECHQIIQYAHAPLSNIRTQRIWILRNEADVILCEGLELSMLDRKQNQLFVHFLPLKIVALFATQFGYTQHSNLRVLNSSKAKPFCIIEVFSGERMAAFWSRASENESEVHVDIPSNSSHSNDQGTISKYIIAK